MTEGKDMTTHTTTEQAAAEVFLGHVACLRGVQLEAESIADASIRRPDLGDERFFSRGEPHGADLEARGGIESRH